MAQSDHNLYIYRYQREDDFRKIEPDVKKLFEDDQYHSVQLKTMERFSDLLHGSKMRPESDHDDR